MDSETRVPVTAAVFTVTVLFLSGCIAYDAASSVAGAGSRLAGTGISVVSGAGRLVLSPVTSGEDDLRSK